MVRASFLAFALLALGSLSGCSDDETADGAQASSGTGGGAICGAEPAAPAAPAPVELTPCPRGWRQVPGEDGSVATCDPWPASGRETCTAIDEAHFPGEPGCVRVGSACPAGDFAEDLPADGVLYVLAGAAAGGDGSLAAPFATIAAAAAIASPGDVIALSKGTFDEALEIEVGLTLWGACVAETLVGSSVPSPPPGPGSLLIEVPDVTLKNLRLGGARAALVIGGGNADVHLQDLVIDGATDFGLVVHNEGHVTGDTVVVRNTDPGAKENQGAAVYVISGGILELDRAVLERSTTGAFGSESEIELADTALVDNLARPDGQFGQGLMIQDAAKARLVRCAVEGNTAAALYVRETSVIDLEDVVIRDTKPEEASKQYGFGIDLTLGSTANVRRVLFERQRKAAILVEDEGSLMQGGDVVVRDTQRQASDDEMGIGLMAQNGGRIVLERALAERNYIAGALAFRGHLELSDLTVRGVEDDEPEDASAAVGGSDGGTVMLKRALLTGSRRVGIQLDRDAEMTAEDVVVRDLLPDTTNGNFGRGLQTNVGARAEVTRALFQRARDIGVAAWSEGSSLELTDVVIEDTLERACAEDACAGEGSGVAIGAYEGGFLRATRFQVRAAAFCGVQVAKRGVVELHEGEVRDNPIGANVQDPEFDVALLEDCVRFVDNERSLDAAVLPVPEVGAQLP